MKFLKYFFVWLCIVALLTCVAGYIYVRVEGKALFERQITKFFGQSTSIESIRYLVPFGVRFHKIEIQNVIEAEDVFLHLRLPFLLNKQFVIARLELVKPILHFVRYEKEKVDFGGAYLTQQEERFRLKKKQSSTVNGVLIDFLSIQDGQFEILDLAVAESVKYAIGQVNGKAMKVVYPLTDQNIKFDIEGKILNFGSKQWLMKSVFSAVGWINWIARDMDVILNFSGQKGVSGKADLKSKKNDLEVSGRLEIGSVEKEPVEQAQNISNEFLPEALLGVLQATQSKLGVNFSFKTKMDDFELKVLDFDGDLNLPQQKKGLDDQPRVRRQDHEEKRRGSGVQVRAQNILRRLSRQDSERQVFRSAHHRGRCSRCERRHRQRTGC
jgi:hypothetical protein